jgi:hypothetical protein
MQKQISEKGEEMGKNEESIGLTILGIQTILLAIMLTFACIADYVEGLNPGIQHTLQTIAAIGLLISGTFIFRRLEWARKLIIASYLYLVVDTFIPLRDFIKAVKDLDIPALAIIAVGLFLFCANICYFMRKDIRMKFVKE